MDGNTLIAYIAMGVLVGFFVMMYLVGTKKIRATWFVTFCDRLVKVVSIVFGLAIVFVVVKSLYQEADSNGWFSHKRTVSVWMSHDWIAGEFKKCSLSPEDSLTCDPEKAQPHRMEVEFHGSTDSLEAYKQDRWNCQRKQESVACKAEPEDKTQSGWSRDNWSRGKTLETWFVRDPATQQVEERKYTLAQAIGFCSKNPKMEIATQVNAQANAFSICTAFVGEFK